MQGSNLRKTLSQKAGCSSSFVPNLPMVSDWRNDPRISRCRNSIWNKISRIGQEKAFSLTKSLENGLLIDAASPKEYMNQETLILRLGTQLDKLQAKNCSKQVDRSTASSSGMVPSSGLLHTWSNGTVLEPAFQRGAGPINYATDYCAGAVDNNYLFPEGGPSHSLIANVPVFPPDHNLTSATTFNDMDVLSNSCASGVGMNLASYNSNSSYFPQQQADSNFCAPGVGMNLASYNSNSSYFPQQQADSNFRAPGVGMNLASYNSNSSYFPQQQADGWTINPYGYCSGIVQKNDSMDFITTMGQPLQSESSNLLTRQHASREFSQVSNLSPGLSSLGDIRHYQHQKLDFQQNLEYSVQQNLEYSVQPSAFHGKIHTTQPDSYPVNQGDDGHQILGQQALKQPQQKFSLGLDGSANMNLHGNSQVPVEEMVLLEYLYYKQLNIDVSLNRFSNFLHSTVCSDGTCNCGKYNDLLKHFDACQSDDCFTCNEWKSRGGDILERNLEFPNRMLMASGRSEAMPRPPKRRKMEPAFGVSLINNASSDQLKHKMVQRVSPEEFSKLMAKQESLPSGNSEAMTQSPERRKMESAYGVSLINDASSDQSNHKMVQRCSPEEFSELMEQQKSLPSGNSEATTQSPERRKMESAYGVSLINDSSSDQSNHKMVQRCSPEEFSELMEQQESLPSGNSEAMTQSSERRKMESAFGVSLISNASSDQLTNKMFQPCSPEAFSELKQQQVSPSSDVTDCNVEEFTNPMLVSMSNNVIKNNIVDDTFGKILKDETIVSQGLEADHMEQDSKSDDEEARRTSEETTIRSNSIVHSTLCKEPMAVFIEEPDSKNDVQASKNSVETGVLLDSNMNTLCEEPMAASIEEPDSKSNEVKADSNFVETGVILNSNMSTPCEEPMAASIEEPDSKSNEVKANSNFVETGVILNSNMNTPYEEPMAASIAEPDSKSNDVKANSNFVKTDIRLISNMNSLRKEPKPGWDTEDIDGGTGFNQDGIELKADQEKETKSPNPTVNAVSLTDFFTSNQIREHITSLRKPFNQCTTVEEPVNDVSKCQLCGMGTLSFAPEPIYCFCCGNRIKRNSYYYYRRDEDDTQHCFCTSCYKNSRGGNITFNGISVSKTDLDRKTDDREFEEPWVECNKCKGWQHSICALYNPKRDLDNSAVYTCPQCHLKEIENGMHVPLPKTAMFVAKDLPRTVLSDHIERRLFKRLTLESEDWAKVKGNNNPDAVLVAENLSVRVVTSIGKQLIVKKEFLDIFVEENYPAEFPYTSKVILLFQQIEGVDVCLFAMYVQEYGSECGYPNRHSLYISYLDSVKYFRPERQTMTGEALRTFVYHEILVGYLDFCKKRGFTTCYIWACPPIKGEDYILYCHPDTQKTPKKDKLRHWYHSMLRKAAEENIVVGLTNFHDQFFVQTNIDSKVTAAHLPYFDGDFWSGAAMDKARSIEQESGGEYENLLKKLVTKRTLKAMGHKSPPSKGNAKDILVMQKLGQAISPFKEDFIIVQLQYVCMHCHEVIKSGKRWFCTQCKKFQECERCHTADSHTSENGENHRLCQVLMDDILYATEKDVILDHGLFDTRYNFLNYCQRNRLQFDSLRRAKYSTMMILFLLNNPALLNVETICRVCCKNVYQCYWKCESCPEFTVCSACYNEKGANCHAHKLTQTYSTAGNQELTQYSTLMQKLQDVIKHASQCHSHKTQPCTYPYCLQIKKLFAHAHRCTIRVSGGCQHCKKVWVGLAVHSRDCRDSKCRIPRCMDLKKHAEWRATQSESRRRAAILEDF